MINDRYSIIDKIGEGRSRVFSCTDKFNSENKFAIKILSYTSDDDELQSFDYEYDLLRKLDHPSIINVFSEGKILTLDDFTKKEFHISENDKFFVMEFIEGVNIDKLPEIKRENVFLEILEQLSSVLYYLHQANYIYFDLKPENILIVDNKGHFTVKLIDFGLSSLFSEIDDDFTKGTAEYIAPEILRNEKPDYRSDLYSLGILLYKIAYGRLPFSTTDELEIFHAHLEKKFKYPACRYSYKIINVIQKLLEKTPDDRYSSSLAFYTDLEISITYDTKQHFKSIFQFVPSEKVLGKLKRFLTPDHESNILLITGEKGSGKTEYLESINRDFSNSIFISIPTFVRNKNFWQQFFNKLIYSDFLYNKIDESLEHYISTHIDDKSNNLLNELKSIFAKISKKSDFVLLIDGIENTNLRIIEIFNEIFPILQANNIKVILSKSNDVENLFSKIDNYEEILIEPFSDKELTEIVESSFQSEFPREELLNLFLTYSDRNPKNMADFFFNMIVTGIIDFRNTGVVFIDDPELLNQCLKSQDFIYEKLYNNLLLTELEVLEIISLFNSEISIDIISAVLKITKRDILSLLTTLRSKNIINSASRNINPVFTNDGFKIFVYKNIKELKILHLKVGETLRNFHTELSTTVLIEQFELADRNDLAKEVIDEALTRENVIVFPQLIRGLLERKLNYNLEKNEKIETSIDLIKVFVNIGEFNQSLSNLKLLEKRKLSKSSSILWKKLYGITLINIGELEKGLRILKSIVDENLEERNKILFEMASAQIELNNYEETENLCSEVIENEKENIELVGRVYNLLGLSAMNKGAPLSEVLAHFKSAFKLYKSINNLMRIAAIEVNIGNISYLMGNLSEAEKHWNKALRINQTIGNVNQEAKILLNYGVFNYEHAKYEEAINNYKRADKIFRGLGNKKDRGLVLTNLGETYLAICEYHLCYDSLFKSQKIFSDLKNQIELKEVLLLLGKFYWIIGNKAKLNLTLKKLNKIYKDHNESDSTQLTFLERIDKLTKNFDEKNIDEIFKIINDSKTLNQQVVALDIQFILINILLDNDISDGVNEYISDSDVIKFCESNPHFEAKRLLLLFKLSNLVEINEIETPLVYLQMGLEIMEKESITEDTISILFHFAKYYEERGNTKKALEFGDMYFAMLQYVIENLKMDELNSYYLKNNRVEYYLNSYTSLKRIK